MTREFVSVLRREPARPRTATVITKAKPGVGLELTLDSSLQYVAERDLARQLKARTA